MRNKRQRHGVQVWITPTKGSLVGGSPVAYYHYRFKRSGGKHAKLIGEPIGCTVSLNWLEQYRKQTDGTYKHHRNWKNIDTDPQEFIKWCVHWCGIQLDN